MSRRTAEASKAIKLAWEQEKERVLEGKGTRDWTPEQQKDIIETGKAYDADGRAFEGQHMKSVNKYPEYQGDPDNIQFLTRDEHLAAHNGSWQNETNWYYDPNTGEKHDFGDGIFEPCKVINLREPIKSGNVLSQEPTDETSSVENNSETRSSPAVAKQPIASKSFWARAKSFFVEKGKAFASASKKTISFLTEHPEVLAKMSKACFDAAERLSEIEENTSSDYSYYRYDCYDSPSSLSTVDENDDEQPERIESSTDDGDSSPESTKSPHFRKGYPGHRWTKDENGERVLKETQIKPSIIHADQMSEEEIKRAKNKTSFSVDGN